MSAPGRGWGGTFIPGGGNRVVPDTRRMTPEQAKGALERHGRELDRSLKELSGYAQTSATRATAGEARMQAIEDAAPVFIAAVSLADATYVTVTHDLGAAPSLVVVSPPRHNDPTQLIAATGRITLIPSNAATQVSDAAVEVVLRATGWGATVVVDVAVYP